MQRSTRLGPRLTASSLPSNTKMWVLWLLCLLPPPACWAGAAERRLISRLLEEEQPYSPALHEVPEAEYVPLKYNPLERPVSDEKDSVPLKFGIA